MPARTGQQYIEGLKAQEREVWLGGERVRDVTTHPGLSGGVKAISRLYDMQHDPALRDVMTYASPATGEFHWPKLATTLAPGSSLEVRVEFVVRAVGAANATVPVQTNTAQGAVSVPVSGTGTKKILPP